jgi:epoxyqueuosine reductase
MSVKMRKKMTYLNEAVKEVIRSFYLDYIGFADLSSYEMDLVKQGGNILRGYKNGISLGLLIPNSIVDLLPERADANVACEYRRQGYDVLNDRLNMAASVVSSFLNGRGYRTLPVPAADRTDVEKALPTVSHKTIAHIAGLGWIGKNCLLITPEHGPRLRLISLLTEAPLETVNNPLEQRCGECRRCVEICPVQAIKGKNYVNGAPREERFDFKKCNDYFDNLKKTEQYAVCGLCLYVCPFGRGKTGPTVF